MCGPTPPPCLQSFENVRKVLEECNVDHDIDLFVSERKTGGERPAPLRYINYYLPNQPAPEPPGGKAGGKAEVTREPPNKALPPIPTVTETSEPTGEPIEDS